MTEETISVIIGSNVDEMEKVIGMVEKTALEGGFGDRDVMPITSSLYEALANAVFHGNMGDENKKVEIEVVHDGSAIEIKIRDEGDGFQPDLVNDPTRGDMLFGARGRGLFIMRKFMDEVKYNDKGNEVTLRLVRKGG